MRRALIVGINYYESVSPLFGCVDDAHAVKAVLDRHGNGSVNFDSVILTGTGPTDKVLKSELKEAVKSLFDDDVEIALFYFAGHGHYDSVGGYICTTEINSGDDGFSVGELMVIANRSKAKNKIIILDSCHSGFAGSNPLQPSLSELSEGITILTASTAEQYATEENDAGVFTTLLVDALNGGAANLLGDITPGSVYAHIDQSLGAWDQRPVFKTNVKSFVSLRKINAFVDLADLRKIVEFFPKRGSEFQLDPSFEPESGVADPDKASDFALLQKFNRVNLVTPVGAPHMYHAAMESKSCSLTVIGEHYRKLVEKGRI